MMLYVYFFLDTEIFIVNSTMLTWLLCHLSSTWLLCHLSSEGKSCSKDSIELVFGGAYAARSFWAHFDLNQPQTSLQMVVHLRKDSEGT